MLKWLAYLACWGVASTAAALSLSDIELNSFLNQPLSARIQLPGASDEELGSLQINLSQGDDTSAGRAVLSHKIVNENGVAYILISSKEAIKEPVLTFTLEASWSDGRLVREYKLLMDPR